jgi:phage terminase large subunit-like protein
LLSLWPSRCNAPRWRRHASKNAPWLDDLRSEVLAFPHGVHDDQVDSISQALGWMMLLQRRLLFTSI